MNWLSENPQTLAEHLQGRPQLAQQYAAFTASIWQNEALPERLLELCRLRIAAIHDCSEQWQQRRPTVALHSAEDSALQAGAFECFTALEQQALELAERMPHGYHDISDAQVASLRSSLGNAGTVALLTALAFFDVNARLSLTLGAGPPGQAAGNDRGGIEHV